MSSSSKASMTPKGNTRGRKPISKPTGSAAKKPPQRGLGVAQLERLRLQERWRKMTEMPSQSTPLESVPVQFGGGARMVFGAPFGGSSSVAMDHGNLVDPRSGFVNFNNNNNDQVVGFQEYQSPREFSSGSDHNMPFDIYSFKKKRFNGEMNGNNLSLYNNIDQNNLNLQNYEMNNNIGDDLSLGFNTPNSKFPRSSSGHNIVHSLDPHHNGVEVVAVHRRGIGSSNNSGNNNNNNNNNQDDLVMEYSFFPGVNDVVTGSDFKKVHEKIWPYNNNNNYIYNNREEIGSVSVGELEASSYKYNYTNNVSASTPSYTNNVSDNCYIDLSLKL